MRPTPHPDAPFDLTLPGRGRVVRLLLVAGTAGLAATASVGAGQAPPTTLVVTWLALVLAAAGCLAAPTVVARVDRHGIGGPALVAVVPWELVARLEVGAHGAPHLLVVHGCEAVLGRVAAQESPPATVDRLHAAKAAGLVPGWVRIDARTLQSVPGLLDRAPTVHRVAA